MIRTPLIAIAMCAGLAACGGGDTPPAEIKSPADLTGELKTAYEQCLYERQAEAVAIEVIEQGCFEQITGNDDPLDQRTEE